MHLISIQKHFKLPLNGVELAGFHNNNIVIKKSNICLIVKILEIIFFFHLNQVYEY
jgi:hypothetical protein